MSLNFSEFIESDKYSTSTKSGILSIWDIIYKANEEETNSVDASIDDIVVYEGTPPESSYLAITATTSDNIDYKVFIDNDTNTWYVCVGDIVSEGKII